MYRLWNALQEWCKRNCTGHRSYWFFGLCTFAGSSFFPVPSDVLLPPMIAGQPHNWKAILLLAVVSSVAGSAVAYLGGLFLFEWLGGFMSLDFIQAVRDLEDQFQSANVLSMFIASVLPLPSKVFAVAAGLFAMPFAWFLLAVLVGRFLRFFLIAKVVLKMSNIKPLSSRVLPP